MTIAAQIARPAGAAVGALLAPAVVRYAPMASEGVGDRVRRYRRLRKFSQQQLADRAETDKGYISRLEAGKIETPGADVLRRIARALDVPVRQLAEPLGWWADEPSERPDWERLLMEDDRFAPDVKDALRTLIRRELERPETKESKKTA